jgi:hypothetical protein
LDPVGRRTTRQAGSVVVSALGLRTGAAESP